MSAGSTVARRTLGRRLRKHREDAGWTVKGIAKELEWSEPRIWRLETGQVSVKPSDTHLLAMTYGVSPEETEALKALARETKTKGWWHSYSDVLPAWGDLYIGLESAASHIDSYEPELIPGLLQTREYARAVLEMCHPEAGDSEVGRGVEVRRSRQSVLHRDDDPLSVRFVMNEAVLHRPTGGREQMAAQLRHLLEMTSLPTVKVRVVPGSLPIHMGALTGAFSVLRFPEGRDPATVYAEGYRGSVYLDAPRDVHEYDEAFARVWGQSLEEGETRLLIECAIEEFVR